MISTTICTPLITEGDVTGGGFVDTDTEDTEDTDTEDTDIDTTTTVVGKQKKSAFFSIAYF